MATLPFTVFDMKYTTRLAAGVAVLGLLVHASAIAAQRAPAGEDWVGVWGYVGAPLPPGITPAAAPPIIQSAAVPLGPAPNVPPPRHGFAGSATDGEAEVKRQQRGTFS